MKNYNDRTIELLRRDMEAFDKQVRDCVVRLYKPIVVCGDNWFSNDHDEVITLLEIVKEVADALDLVHDVCKVTHEHLCHMSLVYSYCESVLTGDATHMDVVCDLIGDILTDEVEANTREIYSPTFQVLDCRGILEVFVLD